MRLPAACTRKFELQRCLPFRVQLRYQSSISSRTDFQANDAKWQAIWQQRSSSPAQPGKRKKYVLPMFAYPSGSLHMGHLRVYTISDVLARFNRMKGYDVLHPTGWDAFGLPAENAAIERGVDPRDWTLANIEKMKGQLKSMNTHFDWEHEISTCSPSFYKHTQKLFLMLYKSGLAYQAEALVNYDPVDRTVLANEQVDSSGRSWRSGAIVEQRMLRQWFFNITAFQQALLDDLWCLSEGNRWPDRVVQQQQNWIGRSRGATITFRIQMPGGVSMPVNVFTTRPDTLYGVTYLALSKSHPIVRGLAEKHPELGQFVARDFDPDSKDGFELPIRAINPVQASAPESLPVFVAPYVLEGYGEGAVMGVPAHDSRDFNFWRLNKPEEKIPIVVAPTQVDISKTEATAAELGQAYTQPGYLTNRCGPYAGQRSDAASELIVQRLSADGSAAPKDTWRLRDWLISRQRYWGTPIPIVHCSSCGAVPVPDEELPVELPKLSADVRGQKGNPLDNIESFVNTQCPSCRRPARRETDTMDTFVDSSWYYARFPDSENEGEMFSKTAARSMLPVDIYVGGVEHAILHLLYARFIFKFLCQQGMIPSTDHPLSKEPFSRLIAQGMVHGKTFSDSDTGRFLKPDEMIANNDGAAPIVRATGKEANITWEKMSKSKHNGVDPISCFQKYGADVTRAHMLFAAPLSEVLQWDEEKIVGVQRWLYRVSRLVDDLLATKSTSSEQAIRDLSKLSDASAALLLQANTTLRSVTSTLDHDTYSVNTVISDLIKLTNAIFEAQLSHLEPWLAEQIILTLVKMLAPIAPAFAEQCFEDLNHSHDQRQASIFEQAWPAPLLNEAEESQLSARRKTSTCAVQINGKLRFTCDVPAPPADTDPMKPPAQSTEHNDRVIEAILASEQGQLWLREKHKWEARKKVIYVKSGKVVNVVF